MRIFTILAIALSMVACKEQFVDNPKPLPTQRSVRMQVAEVLTEALPIHASGKVEAEENTSLSFKTGGIIQQVLVEEGQQVRKGQTLASLDLSEINAQVTQARVQTDKLRADLAKFESLAKDSAIAQQVVDDVRSALQVAEAGLQIAQYNQTHSVITAPSSGIILQKLAESGELIGPGNPVLVFGNSSSSKQMVLKVSISDKELVQLRLNDEAYISFDAFPGTQAKAKVTEIGAQAHPRTGTFEVTLQIEDYPYQLRSGFFAKAEIMPSLQKDLLKVPMQALIEGDAQSVKLFTAENNVVKAIETIPVHIAEDYFTIEHDSDETLRVITEGAAYVQEGEEVNILN